MVAIDIFQCFVAPGYVAMRLIMICDYWLMRMESVCLSRTGWHRSRGGHLPSDAISENQDCISELILIIPERMHATRIMN